MRRLRFLSLAATTLGLLLALQCLSARAASHELRVGILRSDWAPFADDQDNRLVGVSADTLALALRLNDGQLRPMVYPDAKALLHAACAREIDLVLYLADTPERRQCLDFTAPYFDGDAVQLGRPLKPGESDLPPITSARLAVERGSFMESVLNERYPSAERVYIKNVREALDALVRGEVDYYTMLEPVVNQALGDPRYDAIRFIRRYNEPDGALRFGVVKGAPALYADLEQGLSGITPQRSRDILARWSRDRVSAEDVSPAAFFLTAQEEAFLATLPTIRIGVDAGLAPYTYLDASGRASGIAVDYLQYFSQALGIRFQRVPTQGYAASVDAVRSNQLDMLAAAAKDDQLLDGVPITRPYASFPLVIVGRHEATPVSSVTELAGTRVAVTEAGGVGTLLSRLVPNLELVTEPSVSAAMEAVVNGAATTYVDDLASVDVSLQREFGDKLKVIGSISRSLDVGFAVSPELAPRLLPLLNRALGSLPEPRKQAIQNRYIAASYVLAADWTDAALRLAPAIIGLLGVVLILLRSQFLLRREARIRKAAEQQLYERTQALAQARDAAEAASHAKSDFLAMMSHEIRTPMSGVVGLVEILDRSSLDENQRAIVEMLSGSSGMLMQVLNDVLDFSKIEAGKLELDIAEVDLRKLCDLSLGLLAARAHEKGVAVRLEIDADVPAMIRGDAMRLQQILFNLLSNAIKFTEHGTVTLRLRSTEAPGGQRTLVWEVTDTGIGLSAEQLSRLFEAFVQAENATTRRFGGSGLGLTICRRLIELMGGSISLQSRVGVGTTATVTLAATVCQQAYSSPSLVGIQACVDLADESVRHAVQNLLLAAGATIIDAPPAADAALDAAAAKRPAVIQFSDESAANDGGMTPVQVAQVRVTNRPKPAGFRGDGSTYRLSNNPLSWRAVQQVCLLAKLAAAPAASAVDLAPAATPSPPAVTPRPDVKILIVEDHATNRMLLKRQLKLLGFSSDAAVDGKQALRALEESRYQLMLTDCHMPEMNGYELTQRVRQTEAHLGLPRMPILALTAAAEPEGVKRCLDAGMDECLFKPITLDQLSQVLARWLPATVPAPRDL